MRVCSLSPVQGTIEQYRLGRIGERAAGPQWTCLWSVGAVRSHRLAASSTALHDSGHKTKMEQGLSSATQRGIGQALAVPRPIWALFVAHRRAFCGCVDLWGPVWKGHPSSRHAVMLPRSFPPRFYRAPVFQVPCSAGTLSVALLGRGVPTLASSHPTLTNAHHTLTQPSPPTHPNSCVRAWQTICWGVTDHLCEGVAEYL